MDLHSERLRIDALRADDAPALLGYRGDPEVARYQGWQPNRLDEVETFIAGQQPLAWPAPGQWCQRAIRWRASGELIGDLGVSFPAEAGEALEFGITLAPAWQGRGLAREALTALIDHLFGEQGARRIIASVDPRNAASLALLQAVGMRQEAHFRQSLWWRGEWVDDVVFALLASDWAARRD